VGAWVVCDDGCVCVTQRLNAARDKLLTESKRRNDSERFHRLEIDNNSQLKRRMKLADKDVTAEKQKLDELDQHCNHLASEVH